MNRGEAEARELAHEPGHVPGIGDEVVCAPDTHEGEAVRGESEDVIERQGGDDCLGVVSEQGADPGSRLFDVRNHVAVGEHRALGGPGSAAGVLEECEVFAIESDRAQGSGPTRQRLPEGDALRQPVARDRLPDVADDEVDQPGFRRGEHVAHRAHHHHFQRAAVDRFLDHFREVLEHDNGAGTGILEQVRELPGGVEGVGVDHHRARAQGPEQRHRILKQVGHHDRHPVAFLDAGFVLKPGGEAPAHGIEIGVAQARAHVRERGSLAVALDGVLDHRPHRRECPGIDVSGHSVGIALEPDSLHVRTPGSDPRAIIASLRRPLPHLSRRAHRAKRSAPVHIAESATLKAGQW